MSDPMRPSWKSRAFAAAALMALCGAEAGFAIDPCAGTIDFTYRPVNNSTQFAVWIEDDTGAYLGTVFLTNFIGRRGGGNRTADANIDASNGNRLNAMPVWAYERGFVDTTYGLQNVYPPASTRPSYPADLDAVSGATPGPSVQKRALSVSGLPCGTVRCRIEANQSFDFNDYHRYSFYRGQPSVVWTAEVRVSGEADSAAVLEYEGYGSTDGSDGTLRPPDSTLTTAALLLADMGEFRFKVVFTPGVTSVEDEADPPAGPEGCRLLDGPNFPNPFNPSTVIRFQIREPGRVSLTVYDIRGRKIRDVLDSHYPAGAHAVRFDASGLAPGVYFYRVRAGNFSETGKMALVE